MKVQRLRRATCLALDLLALSALYQTHELAIWTPYGVLILGLISLMLHYRRNQRPFDRPTDEKRWEWLPKALFTLYALAIGALIVFLWRRGGLTLIGAVASAVPLLHGGLWWMKNEPRLARAAQLRLAFGFTELLVASILTNEVFLILALFLFTLLATLFLSCRFIESALAEHHQQDMELSSRTLASVLGVAASVLLSAMILFPILPRAKNSMGYESDDRQTGYTERIRLDLRGAANKGGNSRMLMRINPIGPSANKKTETAADIPFGLIRGATLDDFDGVNWLQGVYRKPAAISEPQETSRPPAPPFKVLTVHIERQAIGSDILPVPYGSFDLTTNVPAERVSSGQWVSSSLRNEKVDYDVALIQESKSTFKGSIAAKDLPRPIHTRTPRLLQNDPFEHLAQEIFGSSLDPSVPAERRVRQLRNFFASRGFSPSESDGALRASPIPPELQLLPEISPVLNFLLRSRSGQCELFASSAAMLLRRVGVPTRLVAGFRLSRGATSDGSLKVRSDDAHAWVEYWGDELGWRPFDPTPQILRPTQYLEIFFDAYDSLERLWYHYGSHYDQQTQSQLSNLALRPKDWAASGERAAQASWRISDLGYSTLALGLVVILSLVTLLGSAWYAWRRHRARPYSAARFSLPVWWRERRLARRRITLERFLTRHLNPPRHSTQWSLRQDRNVADAFGLEGLTIYRQWRAVYLQARFGPRLR